MASQDAASELLSCRRAQSGHYISLPLSRPASRNLHEPDQRAMLFSAEIREEVLDPKLRHRVARDNHCLREFLAGPMRKKGFGDLVGNWEDYLRLFSNAGNESAIGEASVLYLWSRTAPEGIAEKISDAKILVMLRDPAERAFSQYLQGVSAGFIGWSFREHIEFSLRHNSEQISLYHPFLELGLYSEQLARYLERFGSNVWIGC
jgi:hypothetical protein